MSNPARGRGDGGQSLIELMITLVILGTVIIAIVTGIGTAVIVSAENRQQTQAAVAVRAYAEAVSTSYVACATSSTPGYVTPPGFAVPAGFTASIVDVKFLNGTTFGPAGACNATTDARLQRVRLKVAKTSGSPASQIDVMLRKPCRIAACA